MKRFSWILHLAISDVALTKENHTKQSVEEHQLMLTLSTCWCSSISSPADIELSCGLPRIDNSDADRMGLAAATGFVGKTVTMGCRWGYAPKGSTSKNFNATCLPSGEWQGVSNCSGKQQFDNVCVFICCISSHFFDSGLMMRLLLATEVSSRHQRQWKTYRFLHSLPG